MWSTNISQVATVAHKGSGSNTEDIIGGISLRKEVGCRITIKVDLEERKEVSFSKGKGNISKGKTNSTSIQN